MLFYRLPPVLFLSLAGWSQLMLSSRPPIRASDI